MDKLRPMAESRGFTVTPQNINGEINVLLERTLGEGKKFHAFSTPAEAAEFLAGLDELPRFRVQVTYADGAADILEIYDIKSGEALARAARAASANRVGYIIKSLEIL